MLGSSKPGSGVFSPAALLPLASALMFALYSLLTRRATQTEDAFLSLFWSGTLGAILITAIGLPTWTPVQSGDWPFLLLYGGLALLANWLLIKCYEVAEASAVQPFAYLQIVFVSLVGVFAFGETLAAQRGGWCRNRRGGGARRPLARARAAGAWAAPDDPAEHAPSASG